MSLFRFGEIAASVRRRFAPIEQPDPLLARMQMKRAAKAARDAGAPLPRPREHAGGFRRRRRTR